QRHLPLDYTTPRRLSLFAFARPSNTGIYTLSLHDALPIYEAVIGLNLPVLAFGVGISIFTSILAGLAPAWQTAKLDIVERLKDRSEEHTSELQSRGHLVCRLLLEKKKQRAFRDALQLRRYR